MAFTIATSGGKLLDQFSVTKVVWPEPSIFALSELLNLLGV